MTQPPIAPSAGPLRACVLATDYSIFPQLIEEMNIEMGSRWQFMKPSEVPAYLESPHEGLEFFVVAISASDKADLPVYCEIVRTVRDQGRRVILVAGGIEPLAIHQLLLEGAGGLVPYPMPHGALSAAIRRAVKAAAVSQGQTANSVDREGVVIPIYGLSGGAGASTLAVNLAWELATVKAREKPKVCLLDLDLQYGSVAAYLDLPRQESIFELQSECGWMDRDAFLQFLHPYREKLSVLSAPREIVPLDLVTPEDVSRLIATARSNFDFVVVDLPTAVTNWTEGILNAADVFFAVMQLDIRTGHNASKFIQTLKDEGLPQEKVRYVINRVPKFGGRGKTRSMADGLDIRLEGLMPEGGDAVRQGCNSGQPIALSSPRNRFRKEVARLSKRIVSARAAKVAAES